MPCAILFRGLGGQAPPGCATPNIPPVLPTGSKRGPMGKVAAKPDCVSEAWMMGVRQVRRGAARGSGSEEQQERLPQNLVPVPGREDVLGNEGSGKFLGWHCDGGFDRDGLQEVNLGDYLMLFGVRGKRGAPTLCCDSIMAVEALSAADQRLLRTEGFTFELTQTGEGKGSDTGGEGEGKPVVRDHPDTGLPQVRTLEFAPSTTEEALGAYQRLQAASKLTYNPPLACEL